MSTPPKRTASARQESNGRVGAPGETSESTHVRRLAPEPPADTDVSALGATTGRGNHLRAIDGLARSAFSERDIERSERDTEVHDTIPCRPPVVEAKRPNDLERTLRFARLVQDTLAKDHPLGRLLELAILRRDAALLGALLKELHRQQIEAATTHVDDTPRRTDRITLLPPPPKVG